MATTVPAAARALAVFEVFAREKRELLKSELARLLDLPESSCSDLLSTLHEIGYVARTAGTKRYYPTSRLTNVAAEIAKHDELYAIGKEAAALLSEKTMESCYFGEIDDYEVRLVAAQEGSHRLRYVALEGDHVAIHATSIGKAILAEMDPQTRYRLLRLKPLRALTSNTIVNPEQLEAEIAKQRETGIFSAVDEGREGLSSFAISGRVGDRLVGLSLTGPSDRLKSHEKEYKEALLEVKEAAFGMDNAPKSKGRPRSPARGPRKNASSHS
ncbi:IclR family transcriptional regulator [Noviherbaspirillum sedimenti]|uniref:IclR family transcriptional regulator n=1 Tax=Noviherbaspirillum sedimenti TaxID=2320865 RepID=A0A3A3G3N3_9BURK|nr:IclR family transcriptional regulator [Noviherbaspirillum sedimenti]RJG03098.1 IclR family transcriptional regulator [Noviherbaspirillum sedimenti]